MITSLFKNTALSYLIIFVVALILWGKAYYETTLGVNVSLTFANETYYLDKRLALILSFFTTLLSGGFFNYKIKKYLFSYEPNNLFLFFYFLFFSAELSSTSFLVYDIAAIFLIIFVNYLLSFTDQKDNENEVFNASLIVGILIFHNLFFGLFLVLLVHNLSSTIRIGFKAIALILIGFCIPTFMAVLLSFITEDYAVFNSFFQLDFQFPKIGWKYAVVVSLYLFMSFVGYRLVITKRAGIDIATLKLTKNLFVYLLISIVISVASVFSFPQHYVLFVLSLPFALFLSFYFANFGHKWKELLFFGVVALVFLLG